MPYKFYRAQTIPCPNCQCCETHSDKVPRIAVRHTYHVRNDDNTETQLTKEEYDAWAES